MSGVEINKRIKAIDVCAGAGGWAVAARDLPIDIVMAFDRDDLCLETYALNHPGVECVLCDVSEHDFGQYADTGIDLVLGGIPCEDISAARRGVPLPDETKASFLALVKACLEVPRAIGAAHWCYEDVVDLLRFIHDVELFVPNFVLDSAQFSPQRRKRVYFGNLPKPAGRGDGRVLASCLRPGPYRVSSAIKDREPSRSEVYGGKKFYPWEPQEKSPTVLCHSSRRDHYLAVRNGDGWRQPEWQELAVLQGFPEDYVFVGPPTRVAKMVGQAVQIDTARAILEALVIHTNGE